jgi:hypothetical protein
MTVPGRLGAMFGMRGEEMVAACTENHKPEVATARSVTKSAAFFHQRQ